MKYWLAVALSAIAVHSSGGRFAASDGAGPAPGELKIEIRWSGAASAARSAQIGISMSSFGIPLDELRTVLLHGGRSWLETEVTPGRPKVLFARVPGARPFIQRLPDGLAGGSVVLQVQLLPGNRVGGQILDSDGQPVDGARVELVPLGEDSDWPVCGGLGPIFQPEALFHYRRSGTGPEGKFLIDGLEEGRYELRITKAGYALTRPDDALHVKHSSAEPCVLPPIRMFSGGVVRLLSDGAVSESSTVVLREKRKHYPIELALTAGHSDVLTFRRVPPGIYDVHVDDRGAAERLMIAEGEVVERRLQKAR